jgi:integrase/recombinase XerD
MLILYRRHGRRCHHKSRKVRNCECPIWVDGTVGGKEIRRTLKTKNWQRAQGLVRTMELQDKEPDERITIEHACQAFRDDAKARGLRHPSLQKYTPLFARLQSFTTNEGLRYLKQLDLETLRRFRATWNFQNYTARNELERLRSLFRFAHDAGWITDNPAKKLRSPRVQETAALPFSREEMDGILKACDQYKTVLPLKALVLLLRYSGLRIRDAVTLRRDQVNDGKLFLRTAKTGTHVRLPLPPVCLAALAAVPAGSPYYFWSGHGLPKSRVGNYQHVLQNLFTEAKVVHGHAHRFRHTFAVELLLAGVPIERVAVLLGHQNIRVTQRHYSAWSQARQEQLEQDVVSTWA